MQISLTRLICRSVIFITLLTISSSAIAQWEQVGWPVYANVKQFATTPQVSIVSDNFQTWVSTDGGMAWRPSYSHFESHIEEHGGKIYALDTSGLFSTTDGMNWQQIATSSTTHYGQICFLGDTIFIYGPQDQRSTDGGATWSPYLNFPLNHSPQSLTATPSGLLFAASGDSLYRSVDRGNTWTLDSSSGLWVQNARVVETIAGLFAVKDDIVIARFQNGSWRSYLAKTHSESEQLAFPVSIGGALIGMGYDNIIRSDDSGASWRPISQLDFHGQLNSIQASNGVVYAFTWGEGGVYRSEDTGVTWTHVTAGLQSGRITALASKGSKLYAMNNEEPTVSSDSGKSWTPIADFTYQSGLKHAVLPFGKYVFSMGNYYVKRSGDSGKTWETLPGVTSNPITTDLVASRGVLLLNDVSGVYRSKDSGSTWQICPQLPHGNSLCEAGEDAYLFLPGTRTGIRTSDAGLTWSSTCGELNFNGLQNGYPVSMFAVGDTLYLAYGSLFQSADAGDTWTFFATLPSGADYVRMSENGILSTGTSISRDNGRTWINAAGNLPSAATFFAVCGDYLFAGIDRLGLWRRPLSGVMKEDVKSESSASTAILSSYPNPFHSATTMTVNLPQTTQASIRIYDLLGRAETIADNTTLTKGTHEFSWQPHAAGYYTCVLTTSTGERSVLKLISRNE